MSKSVFDRMRLFQLGVLVTGLSIAPLEQVSGISKNHAPPTANEIRRLLVDGWARLKALDETDRSFEVSTTINVSTKDPVNRTGRVHWLQKQNMLLVATNGDSSVTAHNRDYCFSASQKQKNKNGWALDMFDDLRGKATSQSFEKLKYKYFPMVSFQTIYPLSSVANFDPDFFLSTNDPEFTCQDAPSGRRWRVEMIPKTKELAPGSVKYVLTTDPLCHYCVVDLQVIVGGKRTAQSTREIEDVATGFVCKSYSNAVYDLNGTKVSDWTTLFTNYKPNCQAAPREFYMSYYDLLEPHDVVVPPKSNPWSLWLGISGAFLLACAIAMHRHVRATTAPKSTSQ